MRNLFLFCFLMISFLSKSQEDNSILKKVNKVEILFQNIIKEEEYLVYSTPFQMHLIFENNDIYYHFTFVSDDDNSDFLLYDFKRIDNSIKVIFNRNNYVNGFINSDSDFYEKDPIEFMYGLPTYFSLNNGFKNRFCEYFLTVFVKPVPMSLETYRIIHNLLISNR